MSSFKEVIDEHGVSRLVRARHKRGMTQEALAALANINKRTLVRIEQGGTPHEETATRLAIAVGCGVDELFEETTNIGRPPRPGKDGT